MLIMHNDCRNHFIQFHGYYPMSPKSEKYGRFVLWWFVLFGGGRIRGLFLAIELHEHKIFEVLKMKSWSWLSSKLFGLS